MNGEPVDPPPSSGRPSTWIVVAAIVATVVVIAGLVVIWSEEGDRLLEDPPVARADSAGGQRADGPNAADGPPEPEELPATSGTVSGTCTTGPGTPRAQSHRIEHDQQCVLAPVDPQPFASPQPISLSVVADGSPTVAARSFVSADGRGYVTAGYVRDDDGAGSAGRFVGAAPGVGAFAGLTIHFAGRSEPDGTIVLHWYVGDGPAPPDATGDEPTAEVEFRCEEVPAAAAPGDTGTTDADATAPSGPVTVEQSCTYTGDEPHAIPEDGTSRAVLTATGGGAGRFGETRFVAATYDSGTVRTLLVDPDGTVRFAGLAAGTEAGADTLVDELGWGRLDAGGATTGVIRLTTVPEDT